MVWLTECAMQLGAVAADNATPNDVMIGELSRVIDGFLGEAMYVHCFDHGLNLMAKVLFQSIIYSKLHLQAMLSAFSLEKVQKLKAKKKATKVKATVPETASKSEDDNDHPFEATARLDDIDVNSAANTEQPMELDGEPLIAAELAAVDLAVRKFAMKVCTLATEADTTFEEDFGIKCTEAECKSASQIMDVVSGSFIHQVPAHPTTALEACFESESFNSATQGT